MTSADSLQLVVTTHFFRIRLLDAPARPPRVLTHSFPLYLPYLPQMIPCSYWTLTLSGVLSSPVALYMISVRQARVSPPSFFRFHLTMDTLDLGYILPTAGRIRDFHPLERALTGRTDKRPWNRLSPVPWSSMILGSSDQILATPVRRAASATALATAGPTRLSKALGMM